MGPITFPTNQIPTEYCKLQIIFETKEPASSQNLDKLMGHIAPKSSRLVASKKKAGLAIRWLLTLFFIHIFSS